MLFSEKIRYFILCRLFQITFYSIKHFPCFWLHELLRFPLQQIPAAEIFQNRYLQQILDHIREWLLQSLLDRCRHLHR